MIRHPVKQEIAIRARVVRRLFGVPICAITMSEVVAEAEAAISSGGRLLIGVVNAAKLVNMRREPQLREAVLRANMILADGMAVVWASRLLGRALPERVAGIDLMHRLLELADSQGLRVYCLGATDDVLQEAIARIRTDYSGAIIAGHRNGYFEEDDEPALASEIHAANPDMLFVAMTSPKKERFLATWHAQLDVPVCHGVGGAFDVMAGKVERAPRGWQRLGLEWLYRVKQEPRRLWRRYLVTNTLFCLMTVSEFFFPKRLDCESADAS